MPNDEQAVNDAISVVLTKGDGSVASGLQETLKMTGRVHVAVYDDAGTLKDERHIHNLVVTAGKAYIAALLQGAAPAAMTAMAVGTGTSAPAAGDTDLQSEITTGLSGTRVSITRTNPTSTVIRYVATWTAGQATNGAITEAGTFNAAAVGPASGTMLDRATFTAIPKGASDSLTITWDVTIS